MFNDVQKITEEILLLDYKKDKEVILAKKYEIMTVVLGFSKNKDGKAYYPLLRQELRGKVPHEDFDQILLNLVEELILNDKYDPKRGLFSTALSFLLNNRIITYLKKHKVEFNAISTEEQYDMYGDAGTIIDSDDDITKILDSSDIVDTLVSFAEIISKNKEMDKGRSKSNKNQFERYFTFYFTKDVKKDDNLTEIATVNDGLFPVMEKILLEFLMFGNFNHLRDIAANELKNDNYLANYKTTIYRCYGEPSEPTIVKRHKLYQELKKSLISV